VARTPTYNDSVNQLKYNGSTCQYVANHVNICYHVQSASRENQHGSLIDGGASGVMSCSDVRIIEQSLLSADVTGFSDHAVKDIPIATVAGVLTSSRGKIIGIFNRMLILALVRLYTLLIKCDTLELKFPVLHSHLQVNSKSYIRRAMSSLYLLEMDYPSWTCIHHWIMKLIPTLMFSS
jgi:hypothetical protein